MFSVVGYSKMTTVFWHYVIIVTLVIFNHYDVSGSTLLTRHCQNRCNDKIHLFCGISSRRCHLLGVRILCPRTCETCKCDLLTCEDGTCIDVWEPSICLEYKKAKKCALTRQFDPMGSCSRTCKDCIPCKLPCTPDCKDYGEFMKCLYFVKAGFCNGFTDAQILCPKSCGVCRKCPNTMEEIMSITSSTTYYEQLTASTAETYSK